jgi:hypothetical protein
MLWEILIICFILRRSDTAQLGPRPPRFEVSGSHKIRHTQTHTHFWTSDQSVAEAATDTTHNKHKRRTSIAPRGIRTRNPSKRAATDVLLRPRGHWDRRPNLGYRWLALTRLYTCDNSSRSWSWQLILTSSSGIMGDCFVVFLSSSTYLLRLHCT